MPATGMVLGLYFQLGNLETKEIHCEEIRSCNTHAGRVLAQLRRGLRQTERRCTKTSCGCIRTETRCPGRAPRLRDLDLLVYLHLRCERHLFKVLCDRKWKHYPARNTAGPRAHPSRRV